MAPKKKKCNERVVPGKVMALVFGKERNYPDEKRKPITKQYYAMLLETLKASIPEKRSGLIKKKVLMHHGNAAALDLASSNFCLLPKLKSFLIGEKE